MGWGRQLSEPMKVPTEPLLQAEGAAQERTARLLFRIASRIRTDREEAAA